MIDISSIGNQLIDELWLPIAKEGGSMFYHTRKKNKEMKMLALTQHKICREIMKEFTKNKLTRKELILGWNRGTNEAIRLECEGLESVISGYAYEDTMKDNPSDILDKFPFDILNLDFSSQNPELEDGRIEKEVISVEHTVRIQSEKGNKKMVLIYTTVLNSNPLSYPAIKQGSDDIRVQEWDGLSINGLPPSMGDNEEKIECLKRVFEQMCFKYRYQMIKNSIAKRPLSSSSKLIFSIGMLLKRS